MKNLITIILLSISSLTFSQNGIKAFEGTAQVFSINGFLYGAYFEKAEFEEVFVTDKVLKDSGISALERLKEYHFEGLLIFGKPIIYFVAKSQHQSVKDYRKLRDSISPVLKPVNW